MYKNEKEKLIEELSKELDVHIFTANDACRKAVELCNCENSDHYLTEARIALNREQVAIQTTKRIEKWINMYWIVTKRLRQIAGICHAEWDNKGEGACLPAELIELFKEHKQ